jgi:hypothetical protein
MPALNFRIVSRAFGLRGGERSPASIRTARSFGMFRNSNGVSDIRSRSAGLVLSHPYFFATALTWTNNCEGGGPW